MHSMKQEQHDQHVLFLRHAASVFNQGEDQFFRENPGICYPQADNHPEFRQKVLFNAKFIDCPLSLLGEQQCKVARASLQDEKIDLVIVSPLRRALQTANLVFGGRNIPFEVRPELTQSFRYACDLSDSIPEHKGEFNNFEFSHSENLGPHWYIENLAKNGYQLFLNKKGDSSLKEQQRIILNLLADRLLFEDDQYLQERAQRIKQLIASYKQKYNKIAIVSHFYTIKTVLSIFGQIDVKNAQPYWIKLAKLLQK